jgi:hypothetical protein
MQIPWSAGVYRRPSKDGDTMTAPRFQIEVFRLRTLKLRHKLSKVSGFKDVS